MTTQNIEEAIASDEISDPTEAAELLKYRRLENEALTIVSGWEVNPPQCSPEIMTHLFASMRHFAAFLNQRQLVIYQREIKRLKESNKHGNEATDDIAHD